MEYPVRRGKAKLGFPSIEEPRDPGAAIRLQPFAGDVVDRGRGDFHRWRK
jgi:hypothetical protein